MYILHYFDDERNVPWLIFDTIEQGRDFLSLVPGYAYLSDENLEIYDEWIDVPSVGDYHQIKFNGNIIPLSNFMFKNTDRVDLIFWQTPNLSNPNQGMLPGCTTVDAYSIENSEVKDYIEAREGMYVRVKYILQDMGFEVSRSYRGSEDGEAVLYKKKDDKDWHFMTHMDPLFVDMYNKDDVEVRQWVESNI